MKYNRLVNQLTEEARLGAILDQRSEQWGYPNWVQTWVSQIGHHDITMNLQQTTIWAARSR